MKYLVIGAGGTGGPIGAYMTKGGKDITLIARGRHLENIQKQGLIMHRLWEEGEEILPVKACDMEHYEEKADVIFVCVKGYSLEDTVPFIRKAAHKDTVVIPILNIYGTGGKLQEKLPDILVTDGCIYVSANIQAPGEILMHGKILRIVFGVRESREYRPVLELIRKDLKECGIDGVLSDNIRRDAFRKFSYVSPVGACGLYLDAKAEDFQKEGAAREMLKAAIREIEALASAMGIPFGEDMAEVNLKIMDALDPSATTSMQRDVAGGGKSEMDGLIFEVVRLGEKYGVEVPQYRKVAQKFGY